MKQKVYASIIFSLIISISILVMIIPSFFTKGISRISLNQELHLPLILDDTKEIQLLFFGYTGCVNVCTPRLQELSAFYNILDAKTKAKVGVAFLDISAPEDKKHPDNFAKHFNKEFKGIFLTPETLREYTKAFRVYFSKSLTEKTEFDHSSNLYLVKKQDNTKNLRYIYTAHPFDFKQIKLDIEELLHE